MNDPRPRGSPSKLKSATAGGAPEELPALSHRCRAGGWLLLAASVALLLLPAALLAAQHVRSLSGICVIPFDQIILKSMIH